MQKIVLLLCLFFIFAASGCSNARFGRQDYINYPGITGETFGVSWWTSGCPNLLDNFKKNQEEVKTRGCRCIADRIGTMVCLYPCTDVADKFNSLIRESYSCQ